MHNIRKVCSFQMNFLPGTLCFFRHKFEKSYITTRRRFQEILTAEKFSYRPSILSMKKNKTGLARVWHTAGVRRNRDPIFPYGSERLMRRCFLVVRTTLVLHSCRSLLYRPAQVREIGSSTSNAISPCCQI